MCVCAAALVKSWSSTRQSRASRVIFTATSGSLNQPLFQLGQHMTLEATLRFGKSGEEKKTVFSLHTRVFRTACSAYLAGDVEDPASSS